MTQEQERLIERLREALSAIAYEDPSEPWLVAHNALKATAVPLHQSKESGNAG